MESKDEEGQMRTSGKRLHGWLNENCRVASAEKLDNLGRQKLQSLRAAIEHVNNLVRDAAWMHKHDPERRLVQVRELLAQVGDVVFDKPQLPETEVRGWLKKMCKFEGNRRLHLSGHDALQLAIGCVEALVRDDAWMALHDPERQLDKVDFLLTRIGLTAWSTCHRTGWNQTVGTRD
jgi:hypothetical protein